MYTFRVDLIFINERIRVSRFRIIGECHCQVGNLMIIGKTRMIFIAGEMQRWYQKPPGCMTLA